MVKEITSASNQLIKDLVKLKQTRNAKEQNSILIEGKDLVDMAYENGLLDMIITSNRDYDYDVQTIICPSFILEKLSSNKSPSDIIGVAHFTLENKKFGDRIVYLDGVQDPGNVGTIIRTALAFSYDSLILSSDSASIYNEKVIQSTKGALFSLPLFLDVSLKNFKDMGYEIIVTALRDAVDYESFIPSGKFVLVLGNEGQGVKEENIKLADKIVKISMGNIDSLNVAVAGGILLNHYKKK